MSNILNHNRNIFQFDINKEDYWDFQLCIDNAYDDFCEGLVERCLSTSFLIISWIKSGVSGISFFMSSNLIQTPLFLLNLLLIFPGLLQAVFVQHLLSGQESVQFLLY